MSLGVKIACGVKSFSMRWGSVVGRFPDTPDSPSKPAPYNSLRPRGCLDYFSLEDIVVFFCWRSGTYKIYPRSYGADHMVCGDHCPTSGHSGPRTPVNDLKCFRLRRLPAVFRCRAKEPGRRAEQAALDLSTHSLSAGRM